MPNLETPQELADFLADKMGVYGACEETDERDCAGTCRPHFISEMTQRIRQAVKNENLLNGGSGEGAGTL